MTRRRVSIIATAAAVLVMAGAVDLFAGGPVCPPMGCGPVMGPPMVCPPPMCPPVKYCGPPCPPPLCKPNPLAQIFDGAINVLTGVIALPFKVVDCVIDKLCCPPKCGPARPYCPPPVACGPPMAVPPFVMGPAPGYGMGHGAPVGFGHRPPKKFSPMARKEKPMEITLTAGADQGFFGAYW